MLPKQRKRMTQVIQLRLSFHANSFNLSTTYLHLFNAALSDLFNFIFQHYVDMSKYEPSLYANVEETATPAGPSSFENLTTVL